MFIIACEQVEGEWAPLPYPVPTEGEPPARPGAQPGRATVRPPRRTTGDRGQGRPAEKKPRVHASLAAGAAPSCDDLI